MPREDLYMETTENRVPQSRRQNPLTFYLRTLLYMFMALLMRIVAFLPLGALLVFPEGSLLRWLAVLTPILLIFWILPLRFSFAQAITQAPRERRFSFDKATSVQSYGAKLGQSLLHLLHIVLWGIPLGLMIGAGYYFYNGAHLDALLSTITSIGTNVIAVLDSIANFFIGIFGGTQLVPNGGLMEGVYTLLAAIGLGVLILLWGALRNSAYRYIWALATKLDKNPRDEAHRRLRGHRWAQLGVGLINLVLWAPALFVVFTTLKSMLNDISKALFTMIATKQLSLPELSYALWPLLFAFFACYLPLLPVRRILTAFFATRALRHTAVEPQPMEGKEPVKEEPSWVTTTSSGAPKPVEEFATAAAVAAPVIVAQAYEPYAHPAQEEEAEEPTPIKAPVPAYEPYHTETPVAVTAPEPAYQPEPEVATPVVEPAAPAEEPEPAYHPYKPEEAAVPIVETVAPAIETVVEPAMDNEMEEPIATEQEDFFAQPYHAVQTVADDATEAEEVAEKPASPYAAGENSETDQ